MNTVSSGKDYVTQRSLYRPAACCILNGQSLSQGGKNVEMVFFLAAYGPTYFAHNDHNIPVSGYHLLFWGYPYVYA